MSWAVVSVCRMGGTVLDGKPWVGRLVIVAVCCHLMLPHCSDLGWVSLMGFSRVPMLVSESLLLLQLFVETPSGVKAVQLRLNVEPAQAVLFGGPS